MDQETFAKVKLEKIRISHVCYKIFVFVVKIPKYREKNNTKMQNGESLFHAKSTFTRDRKSFMRKGLSKTLKFCCFFSPKSFSM